MDIALQITLIYSQTITRHIFEFWALFRWICKTLVFYIVFCIVSRSWKSVYCSWGLFELVEKSCFASHIQICFFFILILVLF